jgi:hypothetical protein
MDDASASDSADEDFDPDNLSGPDAEAEGDFA